MQQMIAFDDVQLSLFPHYLRRYDDTERQWQASE